MKDELVKWETAKLAKKKGFAADCMKIYVNNGLLRPADTLRLVGNNIQIFCMAPTQSLLQRWLREVHKLHIGITISQFGYGYMYSIINLEKGECVKYLTGGGVNNKFLTYEECLEDGLVVALTLIP